MTDDEKTEALKRCVLRCVLDQSVYNTVSQAGDQLVGNIVALLRQHWEPPSKWGSVDDIVTAESVAESAQRLERLGFVILIRRAGVSDPNDQPRDRWLLSIEARDPMTRRGRTVDVDYERAELRTGAR
jgi:hypothetical protein